MPVILCSAEDVATRLGRELNEVEQNAWKGIAEEATVLIEAYLDREWDDDDNDEDTVPAAVPRNVRVVCSRVVARTLTSGPAPGLGASAMQPGTKSFNSSMGPLGHTTTFGDDVVFGSPWLSRSDKLMLRRKMYVEHVPTYAEKSVQGGDYAP